MKRCPARVAELAGLVRWVATEEEAWSAFPDVDADAVTEVSA